MLVLSLSLNCATTTAVQMAAPVPEIISTPSYVFPKLLFTLGFLTRILYAEILLVLHKVAALLFWSSQKCPFYLSLSQISFHTHLLLLNLFTHFYGTLIGTLCLQ
jgi:hypothetical protein